jgi:molecular chaperone DnaJ
MYSLYVKQAQHDRTFYNLLKVVANATAHEITRAYRRLSRTLHPDKKTGSTVQRSNVDRLEEDVRHAYEVLKDDATHLLYHCYGLLNASHAALLLTGHGGVGNGRWQRQHRG